MGVVDERPTGLFIGVMPKVSARTMIMSARLPGVMLPIGRPCRRRARPRSSRTRARRGRSAPSSSTEASPRSRARSLSKPRSVPIVARIVPNRCPPFEQHTSIERLGRMPASEQPPGRRPAVAHLQLDVGRERRAAPASAIIASSSSASELQCTNVIVGAEQAVPCERGDRPVLPPLAVAHVAADADAQLVGQRPVALVTSIVANWLPRGARHSVTRASSRGEPPLAQAAHVVRRMVERADRLPVPMAAAVAEDDARPPDSTSASTAASVCSGVLRLCDQSSSVVIPESSASSVPIRLPA